MYSLKSYRIFIISIILFISSSILFFDIPRIDDIPYHNIVDKNFVSLEDFVDANQEDGKISFIGLNPAYATISLKEGQTVLIYFTALNNTESDIRIHIDLYGENYDIETVERICNVHPGEDSYRAEISYFREIHPAEVELRFFSQDEVNEVEIKDITVSVANEMTDGNKLVKVCQMFNIAVLIISFIYIICYILYELKSRKQNIAINKKRYLRESLFFSVVTISVIIILFLLYRKAKLNYPLIFGGGDELGIYYLIKTIKEYGITLVNHRTGGLMGGDMFDYPYADKLSFLWIKLISLFVDNVYEISNLLYFLFFILIALASAYVCRKLKYSRLTAYAVAILYTFSPFIQQRYGHMLLIPYYMLPFAIYISIGIIEGSIALKSTCYWNYVIVAFVCGFTGMYYAWFTCAILAAAIVIKMVCDEKQERCINLKYGIYIVSCAFGVLVNVIPNIIYWSINGYNSSNELMLRSGSETEVYGLKLIQMVLPRLGHRLNVLASITQRYKSTYPLVNENYTASLGLISVIALVAVILNILGKSKIWAESKLIFSLFLIGTIGGIGTLISVFVNLPVRCYNRISLLIMFLCLLVVANFLDYIKDRIPGWLFQSIVLVVVIIGVLDQTVQYTPVDYNGFEASKKLISSIEDTLDEGDMVFVLPALDWPSGGGYKNHIGYLESDDLIWSYGAAQGREETLWQKSVANMEVDQMFKLLREAGYDGIYFDKNLYIGLYGEEETLKRINDITNKLKREPLISNDDSTYFWDIRKW